MRRIAIEKGLEAGIIENAAHHVILVIMPAAGSLTDHVIQTNQKTPLKVAEPSTKGIIKRMNRQFVLNVKYASGRWEDSWPIADAFIASSASKTLVSRELLYVVHILLYVNLDSRDDFEKSCVLCGKKKSRVFDLEDRQQLKMVANNLTHPKVFLKKCINAIEVSTVKKKRHLFSD